MPMQQPARPTQTCDYPQRLQQLVGMPWPLLLQLQLALQGQPAGPSLQLSVVGNLVCNRQVHDY